MVTRMRGISGNRQMTMGMCSLVVLLMAACGNAPRSGGARSPTESAGRTTANGTPAAIIVHSTSQDSTGAANNRLRLAVSCLSGEQMVGGGYVAGDVFEYAAFISTSYPSDPHTWTVIGSSISHFQLSAEVYCMPAQHALGVQVRQQVFRGGGTVACPLRATLLGDGFQTTAQAIGAAFPAGNGWTVGAQNGTVQGYSLCATRSVACAATAVASSHVQSSSHGEQPGSTNAPCPADTVATGDGFSASRLMVASHAVPAFTDWSVSTGGDVQQTMYAICRRLV